MAGGDGGSVADNGGAGASSSSPPPLSSKEKAAPNAAPPPAALPAGASRGVGPCPPQSPPPPLTGGEFLLHLLQRRPKPQANAPPPPPPPSSAVSAGGRGGGGGHEDPAVAAVGPSIPFPRPPPLAGGSPPVPPINQHTRGPPLHAGGSPPVPRINPHPHGPPPWAGYPGFHQAAPPSVFGPSPPGFHHQPQYPHHYNSPPPGSAAFSPPLGFLADSRDLHRNPGLGRRPQQPLRDGFPMDGAPLLFGSFASDPFLAGKIDASLPGVQARRDVLIAHPVVHGVSTGYDHGRERMVLDGRRPSLVNSSIPDPNWVHQRFPHQWRDNGDRLGQKPQGPPQQRPGKSEVGRLQYTQKKAKDVRKRVPSSNGRNGEHTLEGRADFQSEEVKNFPSNEESMLSTYMQPVSQLDHSRPRLGGDKSSVLASDVKEHRESLHVADVSLMQRGEQTNDVGVEGSACLSESNVEHNLLPQLVDSLMLTDEVVEKRVHVHASRGKDYRSDFSRGQHVLSQRIRIRRREWRCRRNIASFAPSFLAIYESLIPTEEEKAKQKQLLQLLEKLVTREWPNAQLYLYGSCANSFGVSNSDIDVCLAIDDNSINKSEILLKLAEILQSDNLQNVQALTRARVPIVKLMDPVTGISCDICINNILAVVNTKLLRDYAQIDGRLQQLAFIVKHWAKSRGVNDTYQGTLSSYAYVLMCIHFLQLRTPPILPCLQEMEATYDVTVDDVECAFFDQVEKLRDFGTENRESIAELLWAFFSYWAYHHDYANDVISVRTGGIISKQSKDWTRRIGNDRHLICIEDPFELSHDLGRVVDKYTIKILREEFERAAEIMQHDPNPNVKLFEPYVRVSDSVDFVE